MAIKAVSPSSHPDPASEAKQVGKFGAIGVINTLLDFAIFNVLLKLGLTIIMSNVISTTCAMIFSFFANKAVVFKVGRGSVLRQAAIFFAVTAFGLYVLQTGTIKLLTDVWTTPIDLGVATAHFIGLGHLLSDNFLRKNGAKAAATLISLTWNYFLYKRVVFK